jgi:hypothetical protein
VETSNWIALAATIFAFLALVVSGFSYAVNERMAKANEQMADANERAVALNADLVAQNRDLIELTRRMTVANEGMLGVASDEARTAREDLDHRLAADRRQHAAEFLFEQGAMRGARTTMDVGFRNAGPQEAGDVEIAVFHQSKPTESLGAPMRRDRVQLDEVVPVSFFVPPAALDDPDQRRFRFVVSYTDGTGEERREQAFDRRYVGGDFPNWRSEPIGDADA